jgi:hypothetical protein
VGRAERERQVAPFHLTIRPEHTMTQIHRADPISVGAVNESAPIAIRPFLVTCAICSVLGFAVLAGLAHALLSFWHPVV